MQVGRSVTILLVLLVLISTAHAQQVLTSTPTSIQHVPQEGAVPVWSYSLPALSVQMPAISAAALAPNGRCAAVAGVGRVDVLDMKGQKLWTWEYGKVNKFITAEALAVSPKCDEVALVGDSGYKYTWIVGRHGPRVPIQTTSTPLGIAFSHDGEFIALGTGGCDLLLIGKSGGLKWKKTYNQGRCIFGDLSFSPADKFIMLQAWSVGLITLDGATVWMGSGWGMAAARDAQTFVVWSSPNHGPQVGDVAAFNAGGKEMWSRVAPGNAAAISASGDKIAAPVYEEHDFSPEDWDKYQDQPVEIQIFSHSGETLKTLPVEGTEVLAMSPDGSRLLVRASDFIQELDGEGNMLLKIPNPQMSYSKVFVPDDFSGALVWRRVAPTVVEWLTLK